MPNRTKFLVNLLLITLALAQAAVAQHDQPKPQKVRRHLVKPSHQTESPSTSEQGQDAPSDTSEHNDEKSQKDLNFVFFSKDAHRFGFELSGMTSITWMQDASIRQAGGSVGLIVDHENVYSLFYTSQGMSFALSDGTLNAKAKLSYYGGEFASISGWDFIANSRCSILAGIGDLRVESDNGEIKNYPAYVAEPRVGFYFNVLPFLRFGFDVSYRFVAVDAPGFRGNSLSGVSYAVALRGGQL